MHEDDQEKTVITLNTSITLFEIHPMMQGLHLGLNSWDVISVKAGNHVVLI
jgi:hypothetical protein